MCNYDKKQLFDPLLSVFSNIKLREGPTLAQKFRKFSRHIDTLKDSCPTVHTFYWLFCFILFCFVLFIYLFSVVGFEKQPAEKVGIKDLNALVMLELCKKLNIECAVGCDYRELAARFEMTSDDINLISQGKDQTQEVLKWAGRKPENTVSKLREKLVEMGRDDCVAIIDKEYKCEVCLVYKSLVANIYYYFSLMQGGVKLQC